MCFVFASCFLLAQNALPRQRYHLITGNSMVQYKNCYLLTLIEQNAAVKKMMEDDAVLSSIAKNKSDNLARSLSACSSDAACFTERMMFSEKEIKDIGDRLAALYSNNNALGRLVQQDLIPSGTYVLYNGLPPQQLLVKAWEQDAAGINFITGVYAGGKKPNYPIIDSISFNVHDARYAGFLYTAAYVLLQESQHSQLFFTLPLAAALHFLELNERNNAGDYEPMASTVNKPAYDRIKSIEWDTYKYSVILVPGAGPEEPTVALSAEGMLRCRLAAVQYAKGFAPFIVVSGGRVHPYKTTYCEAMEMKTFMMQQLHIPESSIFVEPHARHTTTNMRNCARLIFRYGIPFGKPCITSTSSAQSMAITTTLADRCMKELHEVPFRNGARLSETEAEFFPLIEALHINPSEPMDP